ncbi:hypothetical protein [Anaeromicropila populeti]|uniref:hypothetical protein n=1 Tax=Anaeromicropila populeti TaxID=37658 RepID=UPI001A9A3BE8|nr:hypothetical protein [Anaeromicropila populeti]
MKRKKTVEKTDLPKENEIEEKTSLDLETSTVNVKSKKDRASFIKESCEQIAEADRQIEEARMEYQAVTSYLTDIQKMDLMPEDNRKTLEDAARNIILLTRERSKYQSSEMKLSDLQFRNVARYEKDMIKEIKHMRDNEQYQLKIENDMRHLEKEKSSWKRKKNEIIYNQQYLKRLAVVAAVLLLILFGMFSIIAGLFELDMKIPFIMSIVLGVLITIYIIYEARKNQYEVLVVGQKLNRAISLLNKVKIKCVNNTNALDYMYQKFMVQNSMELQQLWEQYLLAKKAEEKYRSNTDSLNYYNTILMSELKQANLQDCEIWIYQAAAIIDSKEMVEIRHKLNVKRQKLRDRIDFNFKVKKEQVDAIIEIMNKNPEYKEEISQLLKTYEVVLKE